MKHGISTNRHSRVFLSGIHSFLSCAGSIRAAAFLDFWEVVWAVSFQTCVQNHLSRLTMGRAPRAHSKLPPCRTESPASSRSRQTLRVHRQNRCLISLHWLIYWRTNMQRILLHICCGPCSIYPLEVLRNENFLVHGFFYNPHIQPYQEFERRLDTLRTFAETEQVPMIFRSDYDPETFFRQAAFRENSRCLYCYSLRLEATARLAQKSRFDGFTTTLLYSKQQKHELIISIAKDASRKYGIDFLYRDFRSGWREGQQKAKDLGMYRQQYCGCIYSEMERFKGANCSRKGITSDS